MGGLMLASQRGQPSSAAAVPADTTHAAAPATSLPNAPALSPPAIKPKESLAILDSSQLLKPKPVPDDAVQAPFSGLANAINSGNMQVVKEKFPALPASIQTFLTTVFGSYDGVRARTTFGSAKLSGDRAELPITIHLSYRARGTGTPQNSDARLLARLVRHGEKWTIAEMVPES